MSSPCIECRSCDTRMVRGDDGHFRKHCDACGHVGGPYISRTGREAGGSSGQTSLDRFS